MTTLFRRLLIVLLLVGGFAAPAAGQWVSVTPSRLRLPYITIDGRVLLTNGIGSTKTTNGTFTGDASGWTLASGWTYNSNAVDKDGDGTGTLAQDVSAVANDIYLVSFVITNWTVGTVTAAVGGVSGTARGANGTFREYIKATGTGNLTFTPTSTARFTIDTVTVQKVGEAPADSVALWVDDEYGTAGQASLHVRGEDGTRVSLGGIGLLTGSGDVIGFSSGAGVSEAADTAVSRGAAGNLYVGTGAAASRAGTVSAAKFTTTGTGSYAGYTLATAESVGIAGDISLRFATANDTTGRWNFNPSTGFNHTSAGAVAGRASGTFNAASGSGSFALLELTPTFNATSSGTAYGLGIASLTNVVTGGTIRLASFGTTTTDLFTGYTPVFDIETSGAFTVGGTAGNATTSRTLIKKVTGIADNSATDVFTVTVPNANHAAAIKVTLLSSNGSTDAFESSRVATGTVVLARTSGVATVAAVSTLEAAQIATVSGGATHTLAYGVSGMTGAAGATQTFTIQVTIDDSGNLGSNQVVAVAELVNAEATGVTIQ